MATMNRNINLEEINTDALFGIQYLNYQSFWQKIIMGCSVLISIGITIVGSIFLNVSTNLLVIIILLPLSVGVMFGCNYNQDLSIFRFVLLKLTNSKTVLESVPTEDFVEYSKKLLIKEKEMEKNNMSDDQLRQQQKKLLIKLLIGISIGIILLASIRAVLHKTKNGKSIHHEVGMIYVEEQVA